jgi:hypothetical protein
MILVPKLQYLTVYNNHVVLVSVAKMPDKKEMINHINKLQESSAPIQNTCIGTNKMINVKKYIRGFTSKEFPCGQL